jgi:Repeat of unknown function (DUF5648)
MPQSRSIDSEGRITMKHFSKCLAFIFTPVFALLNTAATAQSAMAVEFFNSTLNHYFITTDALEAASIDRGAAGAGWQRSGGQFRVSSMKLEGMETMPVCRFYTIGANSHFFTANVAECANLRDVESRQRASTPSGDAFKGWGFETTAFYVATPNAAGDCAKNTTPIFRLYNNRGPQNDSNHRFTADVAARASLLAQGWLNEGVAFCSEMALSPTVASADTVECGLPYSRTKTLQYDTTTSENGKIVAREAATLTPAINVEFGGKSVAAATLTYATSNNAFTQYYEETSAGYVSAGWQWIYTSQGTDTQRYDANALRPLRWSAGQKILSRYEGRGEYVDIRNPALSENYTFTDSVSFEFAGIESVKTAGGTFDNACKLIETYDSISSGGTKSTAVEIRWLVSGIGIVKMEINTIINPGHASEEKVSEVFDLVALI